MKTGIYQIKNKSNGLIYIGQSVNIDTRWRTHKRELERGKHKNDKLQNDWNKYGAKSFEFSVIHRCEPQFLNMYEAYYIELNNSIETGYNIQPVKKLVHPKHKRKVRIEEVDTLSIKFPIDKIVFMLLMWQAQSICESSNSIASSKKVESVFSIGETWIAIEEELEKAICEELVNICDKTFSKDSVDLMCVMNKYDLVDRLDHMTNNIKANGLMVELVMNNGNHLMFKVNILE